MLSLWPRLIGKLWGSIACTQGSYLLLKLTGKEVKIVVKWHWQLHSTWHNSIHSNAVAVQVSWPHMICQGTQKFTGEVEYCQPCEHLGSWLSFERLMMKSSTLFECGPLSPYIHLTSTRRHSCDRFFATLPLPCIVLVRNLHYCSLHTGLQMGTTPPSPCPPRVHQMSFMW